MAAKVKPRPADVARAKGYVDRVKALFTQQKEIGADISEVCTEAKHVAGLDPTTIRFAARELMMDAAKRSERDEKRAQYLHAIGLAVAAVESGEMSARQAARVYNIGKSSIYKELSVRAVSTEHRDMTDDDLGTAEPVREMVADDLGDPLLLVDKPRAEFKARVRAIAASVKVAPSPVGPVLTDAPPADIPNLPAFLDRRVSA